MLWQLSFTDSLNWFWYQCSFFFSGSVCLEELYSRLVSRLLLLFSWIKCSCKYSCFSFKSSFSQVTDRVPPDELAYMLVRFKADSANVSLTLAMWKHLMLVENKIICVWCRLTKSNSTCLVTYCNLEAK